MRTAEKLSAEAMAGTQKRQRRVGQVLKAERAGGVAQPGAKIRVALVVVAQQARRDEPGPRSGESQRARNS